MTGTMRAVVLAEFGGPEVLRIRDVPIPQTRVGWVLIRVRAFGLNRSELHFRRGMGSFGSLPRIPGIEATGEVVAAPGGEYAIGTKVAALMGGMGRTIDGGYAEYVSVPASSVIPFDSALDWSTLGAIPEMLQTAAGSLDVIDPASGSSVLIRGGTSSVGLAFAVLAKQRGLTVLSTTRNPDHAPLLRSVGVDHAIIDDNHVAEAVRSIVPEGVGGAIELVGAGTLADTLQATARMATVSFTGMLSDTWVIPEFYPIDLIPKGVRLTAYSGEASDLSPAVLQSFLDAVAAGGATVPIGGVFALDDIVRAHQIMESGTAGGKLVVTL